MDVRKMSQRARQVLPYLFFYLASTVALMVIQGTLMMVVVVMAGVVLHFSGHEDLDSDVRSVLILGAQFAAILTAIPATRWVVRRYYEPEKAKRKQKEHIP